MISRQALPGSLSSNSLTASANGSWPRRSKGKRVCELARLQNRARPRNPVRQFAVDQVADDVERTEGSRTFGLMEPDIRHAAEPRLQHAGCPAE